MKMAELAMDVERAERLNPRTVHQQIENIKLVHPELIEDDDAWIATLESETDFNELVTKIVRRIEDSKALAVGTKDRLEELTARKARFEQRVNSLRDLLFNVMDAASVPRIELPECTLSLRNVPPSVVITNEDYLPDIACKFERKPDKTRIKELLTEGPVAGATMSNGGRTISIKIK